MRYRRFLPFCLNLLLLLLAVAGCSKTPESIQVLITQEPPPKEEEKRGLTVNGTATLDVLPDVVDVSLTLVVERPTPKAAMTRMRARQDEMRQALAELGVSRDNVVFTHASQMPVYAPKPRRHIVSGYKTTSTLKVTLSDFDRIGDVAQIGADAGISNMSTHFRSTRLPDLKARVRDMALQAAVSKASQLVTGVGAELGPVLSVSETQGGQGWRMNSFDNAFDVETANPTATVGPRRPLTLTIEVRYRLSTPAV